MANTRNTSYEELLSKAVGSKTNLPMAPNMVFRPANGDLRCLVLEMSETAVTGNMQTNAAAFESSLVAMKAWGVIDSAVLRWKRPERTKTKDAEWCHYQRFLYRVAFFDRLFGTDWFAVGDEHTNFRDECEALDTQSRSQKHLILNVPDKDSHGEPSFAKHEAWLEIGFGTEGEDGARQLAEKFQLRSINRQLPVGLFKEHKSASTRIFTGGASAIDLVGIGEDESLWIFELKKKGNHSLGVISELMFYSACMNDLRNGGFVLHGGKAGKRWSGDINDIAKHGPVHAVFLTPTLHPLLDSKKHDILNMLNTACRQSMTEVQFYYQLFDYSDVNPRPGDIKLIE